MFVMHDLELRGRALELIAAGVNDCEVGRRLGVARTTVRHWRWATERGSPPRTQCWRCWRPTRRVVLAAADYAELLGLYLGDGHISPMPRSERLRLSLDARYPAIVAESEALLRRVFPECRVGRLIADGGSTVVLWVYHRHLSCLFPQHGPGKKHKRLIELEPWQHDLVGAAPWAFVRGCIRSDGCAFINRTDAMPISATSSATGRRTSSGSSRRPARRSACIRANTAIASGSAAGRTSLS
jgi:hypothetical protein